MTWFVRAVYGLFFVSGALGLVYEVLWLRKLLLVFGSTVHAVSTVLTVFFGGLALGSWLLGGLADRKPQSGLLLYAACELGIGLFAFVTVPLFSLVERLYIPLYRASGFSPQVLIGASFVCSAIILLIPTTLMGGTFPILSRFLIRTTQERGVKIASLYGINTVGAMCGTLCVYFVALQSLGWLATLQCAGLLNILLAILARALDRALRLAGFHATTAAGESTTARVSGPLAAQSRWLMAAFGLSGFSAMVYEVAWTRSLSLVLGSSIYAFCLMLATFLGGIALGSFVSRRYLGEQTGALDEFVVLQILLAGYGLFSISLFGWMPDIFALLWPLFGQSFTTLSVLQVIVSMIVMALPTFFMGVLFPIVSDLVTGGLPQLGSRLGRVYAVNTLGGILGSALSGFWLIPRIGIAWTLVVAAVINLLAGLLMYLRWSPGQLARRAMVSIAAVALVCYLGQSVFVPSWQRHAMTAGVFLDPMAFRNQLAGAAQERESELLFYRESLNATVSVHRSRRGNNIYLKVGGKTDASTGADMGTQILSAHLPIFLHGHPQRVLVIGMGSGITLGSASLHELSTLDCAEIDPAVVDGARFFADYNYRVHDDPRTRIYVADGRNFLLANEAAYDIIISEPSNPWMAGVAALFTKEFYELARSRLAPGGIMAQWIQLYRIFPSDVKLVLRTFQEVFPHVSVWSTIPGDLLLIGSREPRQIDVAGLERQMAVPAVQKNLERIRLTHPLALLEFYWLDSARAKQMTADSAWLHVDDRPWLEFSAPKALHAGPTFETNYNGIRHFKLATTDLVPSSATRPRDAEFYASLAAAYQSRSEQQAALEALEQAVAKDPSRADAYGQLGELYVSRDLLLKARDAFTKAINLQPDNVEARQGLARLLWRQDRRQEALAAYLEAALIRTPDGKFAQELASIFDKTKQRVQAAELLRSAMSQQDPVDPELPLAMAGVLKELDQLTDATHLLTLAIARHPNAVALHVLRGQVFLKQERLAEARQDFGRVLEMAPITEAHIGLGEVALKEGKYAEAAKHLKKGLSIDPYNVHVLELLREIQQRTADHG